MDPSLAFLVWLGIFYMCREMVWQQFCRIFGICNIFALPLRYSISLLYEKTFIFVNGRSNDH